MKYPAYPAYTATDPNGASFPAPWPVQRLRFHIQSNPVRSEVAHLAPETLVTFVPMEAVHEWGGMDTSAEREVGDVSNGYTYFANGDVVIAKITPCFENGKGAIAQGLSNGVGFGTTELHVIRPNESLSNRWVFYLTMSHLFRKRGEAEMFGAGGQKRVPEDFIRNLRVGIPSLDEQERIADFLDWRTAQIDALIAKKQALIERLQENREAVIRHAVSGALDGQSVFKDSGVKWLGAIPEHWSVSKIKFVAEIASGHTPSRSVDEYWQDCTIPWVSLNDSKTLRERDFISETHYQISELGLANSSARLLPAGVVVFSRDATVGLCAITEVPMAVSQHFIAYICGERLLPKFLLLVLKAMQQHLRSLQTGSTIVTIGMPEVRGLETPLPPLEEQLAIVKHIDDECASLDESLRLARDAIEKLTEYRSALITAAVTGQIDVRGVPVPV